MSERRSLVEGLKPITTEQKKAEEAFVFGDKNRSSAPSIPADAVAKPITLHESQPADRPQILPQLSNRVPITTRTRPEVASALKRASLQRQLEGTPPYYVQEILEEALETWLRQNHYL